MYQAPKSNNLTALDRIIPPPTIRSQRRIAKVRLRKMQGEFSAPELHLSVPACEVRDMKEAA
jgi:hypothetical protein